MKTKLPARFARACALLLLLTTSVINSQSSNNGAPGSGNLPPQEGLRLWLKADTGVETNNLGQVTRWCDQSTSQAHAVLAPGSTGPQVNNSSNLGFTTIAFNGQTGALQLPSFLNGAMAATAYIIVESEKTTNPLWTMGATTTGALYPNQSGKIEDDFASTMAHTTQALAPPLFQWHAYQMTSLNGAWWPALDQTLLPTRKNMAVQSYACQDFFWNYGFTERYDMWVQLTPSISYSGPSPLPAYIPESGNFFEATVQAIDPTIPNNYFGFYRIYLEWEDGIWYDCYPNWTAGEYYFKRIPYINGFAHFTLTMDEIEAFLGISLPNKRVTGIELEFESIIMNSDSIWADDYSYYDNNTSNIKMYFSSDNAAITNQFSPPASPAIGGGFKGEIAEILIYDQTAAVNESVNNYLSSKYGIFVVDLLKDSDGDGIPDAWEIRNGLNPLDPSDAREVGGDGITYIQKYMDSLQTGPKSPDLELEIFSPAR